MPIDAGDVANTAFGLAPFGYHGADHAEDGHPGWDIEYRIGGIVRAAAAGTVQSVFPIRRRGRFTVQIEHIVGAHHYRTVYTNLASVNADDRVPAKSSRRPGAWHRRHLRHLRHPGTLSYAMTHFQLDDLEYHREVPNPEGGQPRAVSDRGREGAVRSHLWSRAAYAQELVEPFVTNPRELAFPASRTWTRAGGDGPAGIRFTRRTRRRADYEYALLAESGTVIETGSGGVLNATARPLSDRSIWSRRRRVAPRHLRHRLERDAPVARATRVAPRRGS